MTTDLVIRARKFQTNTLLDRKQFIVDVYHQGIDASKKDVIAAIAKKFRVQPETVSVFGFRCRFGGGRS